MTPPNQRSLHIVTVGTSALANFGWTRGQRLPSAASLARHIAGDPRARSAELNALIPFIETHRCSSVHLLATDTPEGVRCMEALARFLAEQGIEATQASRTELLPTLDQPGDTLQAQQDINDALRRFRDKVFRVVQRARKRGEEVMINATGGLKHEVAVAALVAAELSVPAYYIHQFNMDAPVYLPTVAIDRALLETMRRIGPRRIRFADARVTEPEVERLERQGLLHVQRNVEAEPTWLKPSTFAKHLLKTNTTDKQD